LRSRRLSAFLFIFLALLLVPPLFSLNVENVEAAQTADPIDAGITDLKAKVNATYARGDCWSVKYEDGVYKWQTEPMWVWSEEEQRYVPYIFEDKFASEGYIQVQSGLIGARIYQSYAMYYDPSMTEVRLYQEQWEVQQWNPKNNKWAAVIGSYSTFEGYLVNKDEKCVNVTMMYSSWAGWLNITYAFHEGDPLKHTVVFKSTLDYETDFRVIQKWAGIAAAKVKHAKGEDVITSAKTINSHYFEFLREDGTLSIFENQWSMYYGFNETTGEVYVKANECLKPVEIDVHAQGLKCDFVFGNWTLVTEESLVVDPDTMTVSPPTADTYVSSQSPSTNYGAEDQMYVTTCTANNRRAFLKFNLPTLPEDATITLAKLRLMNGGRQNLLSGVTDVEARRVADDSWTESGITWSNQPDYGDVEDTKEPKIGFVEWDITSFVLDEYAGDKVVSICLKCKVESYDDAPRESRWHTKEYDGYDPELNIQYTVNTPPNAPTLNSPADSARFNPSASVSFSWAFNDPDAGDSQSAYQLQIAYDSGFTNIFLDTGKVSSSSTSTTRTLPSDVGVYYWRVKTWDSQDAEGAWSSGRAIIVDRVQVTLSVADSRIDVGSAMSWSFTAVYEYDGADATPYVTVSLNDTATKTSVGKWAFAVSSITESQYGLTAFASNIIECIWDRVQITLSVSDTRIDVGSTMLWSFTATYEYDGSDAAPYVAVTLNDTATKSTVGKWAFTVSSITDSQYGLTTFTSNTIECIWDKVQIALSISDARIDVGSEMSWSYTATYSYDGADATPYITVILNDTTAKTSVGKWAFTVSSITDTQYGLTVFESNTIECVWDRVNITAFSAVDNTIKVGEEAQFIIEGVYEYDNAVWSGTYSLNDTLSHSAIGKYGYRITSITDDNYDLTAFIQTAPDPYILVGFNSTDLFNLNNQYRSEGKPYIQNTTHMITALTFTPKTLTFKVEEIPAGETSITTVKGIWLMPTNVYIDGSTVNPKSTKEEFDSYGGKCWYYDSANDLIYIKTTGSLIEILWEGYTPPPPAPPVTPAPPPTTYGLVVTVTSMGRPVPDLKVEVYSDSTLVASGTTDQQGIYSVSLPPGTYRVVVYLDKEKITETVTLNEPKTLTITVPAAPTIEITRFIGLAAILTILLILLTAIANYIRKR